MQTNWKLIYKSICRFRKMLPKGLMYSFTKSALSCSKMPATTDRASAKAIWEVRDSFFIILT